MNIAALYNMEFDKPYDCIFSLGYRCSSAGILKSLGLKKESYPFDWMVSRLPIIEHCINTNFKFFLTPIHYNCTTGVTNHYSNLNPESRTVICKESICFNKYYEFFMKFASNLYLYFPRPISVKTDAFGYRMMMNHHNIKHDRSHKEYFERCVERWNNLSTQKTLSLYIHPAVFYDDFATSRTELIEELRRAHKSISEICKNDGIYIIPVKTPYDYPTNYCCKYVLEEQPDDLSVPGCRICILWTNRDFIDAGEIFMGDSNVEIYVIKDYLTNTVLNRGLLKMS